ncbi:amino acid adenylation domain-containing protein [Qiania dongpingensis]|uniref:Amino acid adenylation domain-containing protein n=1 Tax=Qiania dongpingensis TaxID=2763669 RepID=A0A7G9G1J3_9FIRM|nr:amino acid adenylation domain-containing protein [Qiania dongpingensis]QNM04675.1 amino acid adenylation domain-containing protein [Qiania dongpingensis]
MKNVLELLERSAEQAPCHPAFFDDGRAVSYQTLMQEAQAIGSALLSLSAERKPVAILMEKSARCISAMFGILYCGAFYVVMDPDMPADRMEKIFRVLSPAAILAEQSCKEHLEYLAFAGPVYYYEDIVDTPVDHQGLSSIRARSIDTDAAYALFTSGSTGLPKGTVVCHRSILAYSQWVTGTFHIDSETIFGNQAPLYFSMSVLDIYGALRAGSSVCLIPRKLFAFPVRLLEYIRDCHINTIYWVPSALCLVTGWKALDYVQVPELRKILFAGEVMSVKHLNLWRSHLPDAYFANLYGPTEVTDICSFYEVNRYFNEGESIPIGRACDNCGLLVLTDEGREAGPDEEGELCVRGSFLAMGYYNDPEKTAKVFVQNPLNPHYPELIYKTGDLVRYNERGELLYIGRKDSQIKRMGYRIELGEIEAAADTLKDIKCCACIYDEKNGDLCLFYEGRAEEEPLRHALSRRLPHYMLPSRLFRLKCLPHNANGKIDRLALRKAYQKG